MLASDADSFEAVTEPFVYFHHFLQEVSLFCNKTINNDKMWICTCTKAEFLQVP